MSRYSTRFRPPPVRIGLTSAAIEQQQMVQPAGRFGRAAGNFGAREGRFASVPVRLRVDKYAGANTASAQQRTLAMGRTRRKRGYPPIPLEPEPRP